MMKDALEKMMRILSEGHPKMKTTAQNLAVLISFRSRTRASNRYHAILLPNTTIMIALFPVYLGVFLSYHSGWDLTTEQYVSERLIFSIASKYRRDFLSRLINENEHTSKNYSNY
jgi:hypothetical protein